MSGALTVVKKGDLLEMDFPAYDLKEVPVTPAMEDAFGTKIAEAWLGRDLLCVAADAAVVPTLTPDQAKLAELDGLLQHITAKGDKYDSISRTFAPKLAVAEDPVCGSGHCHIVPLWAKKLGKDNIVARQVSPRGGTLYCEMQGERLTMAGSAVLYSVAELNVEV